MRGTLKHVSLIVCGLTLSASIAMIFQNCSSYQPTSYDLTSNSLPTPTPACNGYICTANSQGLLIGLSPGVSQINIVQPSPSPSPIPDPAPCTGLEGGNNMTSCFDVSGYCDAAAFPNTQFTIQLLNAALVPGTDGFAERGTTATCDANGRFRLFVNLPPNYQYSVQHTLVVKMYGIDSNGSIVDNPNQGNKITIPINAFYSSEFP